MVASSWAKLILLEKEKDYYKEIERILKRDEEAGKIIFPPNEKRFAAFDYCSLQDLKVVIIGQDPYHGEGQANGLSFSVAGEVKLPPSLKNIYKELENDLGVTRNTGDLSDWASQGVLLLNSALTVLKSEPGSHAKIGWQNFLLSVIDFINKNKPQTIFLLWGEHAKSFKKYIDLKNAIVLESAHPSPFSARRGFFGSRPFSKINEILKENNNKTINW